MGTTNDSEDIPTHYERDRALTFGDALAMTSSLLFLLVAMGLAFYMVCKWFGVANNMPLREQLHGGTAWLFGATATFCSSAFAVAGKYLWLAAMSSVLSKADIGPLVAYGLPRRISRLDRTIINRLYKVQEPGREARTRPDRDDTYVCRLHGLAYGTGAVVAFGLGWLPIMRDDPRLWWLAGFFGGLALLSIVLEYSVRRKNRDGRS